MRDGYGYFEEDQLGQIRDFSLWRRILVFGVPHWRGIAAAVLLSFLVTGATLAAPYLVRIAVDHYIVNEKIAVNVRLAGLGRLAWVFAVIVGIGFVANFLQVYVLEGTGQKIMHGMRQGVFSHLMSLDLGFFQRNPTGKLVTRVTNDIQNMHEMFTSVIVTLFNDLLRLVGILVILYWMNWRLALLMSLLVPLMLFNILWFSRLARGAFRAIRTHLARINAFLQEALTGIALIQLFSREKEARRTFGELNLQYFAKSLHQIKIFGIFMPSIELLGALATGGIIWYGGGEVLAGRVTLGILVAFLSYMRLFFQPLRELAQKYSIIQSAMASAERIFQLMDTAGALARPAVTRNPVSNRGRVEFLDVTFGYDPAQPVLHGISFTVSAGERVAIVGATGSGKSTVINLLERFYDPDAGEVRVDGADIRTLDLLAHRRRIGLVMQDVFIVSGSVKENILLGRELEDQALQRIIEQSRLAGLVARLPQGWDTVIGEGGVNLSAGQKQLLAFARVLTRDPSILVMDEATSNVDSETEMLIDRALEVTLANRTSLIIAHRLSTVRRADRILVMAQGRLVEQGRHEQLLAGGGLYATLHALQFTTNNNGAGSSR